MGMKVVDSTFLVDLFKGKPLMQRFGGEVLLTTQINMYEVLTGIFHRPATPPQIARAEEFFEYIRVLPLDDAGIIRSAKVCADLLRQGQVIDDCDCLTVGIALSHGVHTIVTKNKKHFERVEGINVESH